MMKGNLPAAEQLHRELYPLCKAMFIETNPVPVKTALSLMGKIKEVYRLPMVPISDANKGIVKKAIETIGLI